MLCAAAHAQVETARRNGRHDRFRDQERNSLLLDADALELQVVISHREQPAVSPPTGFRRGRRIRRRSLAGWLPALSIKGTAACASRWPDDRSSARVGSGIRHPT